MTIAVWVFGIPAPQGSKTFVGKGRMKEASKALPRWRHSVEWSLRALSAAERAAWPLNGPITVELEFVMLRPKATPKSRTPPAIKKPDLDKLARAVLDAIGSAGVYRDDAQVVAVLATKRLAERDESPGVRIVCHSTAELPAREVPA